MKDNSKVRKIAFVATTCHASVALLRSRPTCSPPLLARTLRASVWPYFAPLQVGPYTHMIALSSP